MATKTQQNDDRLVTNEGGRIHPSWLNAGDLALAIMRGDYDDHLSSIANACKARIKDSYRKGQRYKLTGTRSVDLEGKVATIIKVNQKSISVGVGEATTDQWGTTYSDGSYNVPPAMLGERVI